MRKTYARWAVAVALAAGLGSGGGELGAQAVNVSGTWIFDVTTDGGTGTPTVMLEQVGDSISGHYSSENLGEADLLGTVQGNQITFTFSIDALGFAAPVTYQGTVESATSMRGTMDIAGQAGGTFTATQQVATPGVGSTVGPTAPG